jgi:hypothetical protein
VGFSQPKREYKAEDILLLSEQAKKEESMLR